MSIYEIALFVHILGVVVWLGGAIWLLVIGAGARKGTAEEYMDSFKLTYHAASHLMPSAAFMVVLSGIYMVIDAWDFSEPWVSAGLTVFILSLIAGIFFYTPEGKRILALTDERGPEDPEVGQRMSRYTNVLRVETLLILVVVLLMIIKP